MTSHSRLSPSAADRWVRCPGSVRLSEQFPELTENPAAAQGTAAHWAAYQMFKVGAPKVGDVAENGVLIDQEMIDAALTYYNTIFAVLNLQGGVGQAVLEERVEMPRIHQECFGTPDAWAAVKGSADWTIYVFDFKYGHGNVDAFENWQMILYAEGILEKLQLSQHDRNTAVFEFRIVQPRAYHPNGPVDKWVIKGCDLVPYWARAQREAHNAMSCEEGFEQVGEQCRYCPARRACPTLGRNAHAIMDLAGEQLPWALTGHALGLELAFGERAEELLKARNAALREQAEVEIRQGKSVPGYGMASGRGATKWKSEDQEVLILGDMLGVDLAKPRELVTPTQAKQKLKKAGIDESVIAAYSEHIPGAQRLEATTETSIKKAFT